MRNTVQHYTAQMIDLCGDWEFHEGEVKLWHDKMTIDVCCSLPMVEKGHGQTAAYISTAIGDVDVAL